MNTTNDFVWPSDRARAESHELNRVCEELEAAFDQLEAANGTERVILDGVEYGALLNAEKHGAVIQLCSVGHIEEWTDFRERQARLGGNMTDFPASRYRAVIRQPVSAQGAEPVADFRAEIRTERDICDEYQSFLVLVHEGKSEPYMHIPETLDDYVLGEALKRLNYTQPQSAQQDPDIENIQQRDRWEEKATELAVYVGEFFDIDVGEHTSANCPVENAIKCFEEGAEVPETEIVIGTPEGWRELSRCVRSLIRQKDLSDSDTVSVGLWKQDPDKPQFHAQFEFSVSDFAATTPQPAGDMSMPTLEWAVKRCQALQSQGFDRVRLDVLEKTFTNAIESHRPNSPREQGSLRAGCYDCGLVYGGPSWIEAVIPDEDWEVIKPAGCTEGAGLLCIACIAKRLREQGCGPVPVWLCGTEPLRAMVGSPTPREQGGE